MRSLILFIICSGGAFFTKAQDIVLLPLKKVYHINREKASCDVRNLSQDTVYYQVGLEIIKDGKLIGQTNDVYKLFLSKVEKVDTIEILKPKQTMDGRMVVATISKESLNGINAKLGSINIRTCDFRFKVMYGKHRNTINKIAYSSIFKISKSR